MGEGAVSKRRPLSRRTAHGIESYHIVALSVPDYLVSAQIAVASEVSQAYIDVRSAEHRVTAAGTEVINAREGVRIATGRYQAGIGQIQDLLTAQQALYTALSDQVNAQASLETARVAFDRAMGLPIATGR
jgi:outer membrane protein TolC